MEKVFLIIILCLPFILFSQKENDSIVLKENNLIGGKKSNIHSKNHLSNPQFTYCDTDSDGHLEIDLNEIINYVLSENANLFGIEEGIYVSTSGTAIRLVTDLEATSPTITTVCNSSMSSLLDIAVSENNEYYIAKSSHVYKLNNNCTVDIDYNFNINGSITSLSFDRLNNLYMGGFDSKVYRLNSGNYSQMELWQDFGTGYAGGDFVMYNDKMYVAWNFNETYNLLEVTVNANNDYISHNNLGIIPSQTYGLASELGKLYGITPDLLYKINIPNLSIENVLVNPGSLAWYGAAGKNEAVNFVTNAFENLTDAQNNENVLPTSWTNTIAGGQTIYISITETLNNQNIIIPVDIIVNTAPSYTNPILLSNCISDLNPYEFDIRSTEGQILGSQNNVSINYYENYNDAANNTNPLSDSIIISSDHKLIFVKLINLLTDCSTIFNFSLKVENKPSFSQPKNLFFCNAGTNISIPISLNNINDQILNNQSSSLFIITFHDSLSEAESNSNPLQNNYLVTTNYKEFFFRVESVASGCFSTGSFTSTVTQEYVNLTSNFLINISEWTVNNNTVCIFVDDQYIYLYSLDGINYQTENFFNNLFPGEYNVYIKNLTTCEVNIENVIIFMYPKFFSPNNDGYNDFWKIKNSNKEDGIQISIYDRYGKLIKILKNNDIGWDGTHNNKSLPATDYWFTVTRKNGKVYKGHFALIR